MHNRLIFHRGHEIKTDKIPHRQELFLDGADWCSGLAKAATKFFTEVFYVMTVPEALTRQDINCDGVTMKVITKDKMKQYVNECNVFLKRANPDWLPPSKPLTIFYGASARTMPKHKWDIVLTSDINALRSGLTYWVKGGNQNFWNVKLNIEKIYDFVIVGRKQKNISLVHKIVKMFPKKKILMIGWEIPPIKNNNIKSIGRTRRPADIRKMLLQSKWGLICTCNGEEGYPMSTQLEYSLCGLPYIYGDKNQFKIDKYYSNSMTCVQLDKLNFDSWEAMSKTTLEYAHEYMTCDVAMESLMQIIQKKKS